VRNSKLKYNVAPSKIFDAFFILNKINRVGLFLSPLWLGTNILLIKITFYVWKQAESPFHPTFFSLSSPLHLLCLFKIALYPSLFENQFLIN